MPSCLPFECSNKSGKLNETNNFFKVPDPQHGGEDASLHEETGQLPGNSAVLTLDTEVNSRIRSLNIKQRDINEVINKWAMDYIKNRSCIWHNDTSPLHLFITGSRECGKSHLIKTV